MEDLDWPNLNGCKAVIRCRKETRRYIAMRQFSLYAICLMVYLCGTVSAQQDLVELKAKDDPCAHFKMRILVPGNHIDFKRQAEKLKDGIDHKMVWNPCPQDEPQFAFAPAVPAPNRQGNFLRLPSFEFPFSTVNSGRKKHAEFPVRQPPSPFDKWRQP